VTGIGPRRGSEPDREPRRQAGMDPDAQAAAAGLFHQAYIDGREHERARLTDPQAGYDLGHDVGLGARTGRGRAYVVRIMQGHADGLEARHELLEAAGRGQVAKTACDAHARIDARQQEAAAETQPELQAEAG
jgi:hypothetical protein